MSISLYRKYRPQSFADVYGQKSAIDILTNSIVKKRVGHAYLFSGSRGCGKTSVARIFAKAINCLDRQNLPDGSQGFEPCGHCSNCESIKSGESLDVIEIDGASNNGVDNIRDLKENVTLAPLTSKYKIYIVDEVHMLSQGAFNALLKTLEEPPEHVIFILATTEPNKVPVTIRSRCQHIPFHTISPQDIYKRLEEVCRSENFNFEPAALWEISRQADGALRDALSLLEQVTAAGDITLANVEASFGTGSRAAFERWLTALRTEPENAYEILKSMFEAGASGVRVFEEIFALVRDLWLVSKWQKIIENLGGSEPEKKFLREESSKWRPERLHYLLSVVNKILTQARMGLRNDIILGMFFMMIEQNPAQTPEIVSMPKPTLSAAPAPATVAATPAAQPAPVIINDKPNIVNFDAELKEKIINAAHENEKNFLIYCGLFDSRPYEQALPDGGQDKNLILDFSSPYCYEFFRQDRNSATLSEILSGYSSVIVKFGVKEFACRSFKPQVAETPQIKNAVEVPENNFETPIPEEIPAKIETREKRERNSPFDKFKQELARLQTKPEVILITHNEAEEEENENVLELESEGDNE